MSLVSKIHLCYVNAEDLRQWIKENNLLVRDFAAEKERWKKEVNQKPNFFSDTELLLMDQDFFLLKVFSDNQANFLSKTYQLEYQNICQRLFQASKNIILINERQWKKIKMDNNVLTSGLKEQQNKEKVIVLLKNRENIEKSLLNWLKEEPGII